MEYRKYKYDVFISYSRRDYTFDNNEPNPDSIVAHLLDALDDACLSYWIDKEGIYTGDEFQEVICSAIEESRVFLFVSSKASNSSEWTPGEIQTAIDLKMPIIPFRIDDTIYNKKIRIRLSPIDRIDYFKLGDKSFNTLIASLQEHVGRVMDVEREELRKIKEQKRERQEFLKAEAERKRKYERIVAIIETLNASIASAQADKRKRLAELEALGFSIPEHLQEPDSEEIIALKQEIARLQQQLANISGKAEVPPPIPAVVTPINPQTPEENELKKEGEILDFIKTNSGRILFIIIAFVLMAIYIAINTSGFGCQRSEGYAHNDSTDVVTHDGSTYIVVGPEEVAAEALDPYNGHEYVDLGLPSGLLWATCNVGASSPEEYGDYFAWGETEPKDRYDSDNSKTYGKDMSDISGDPRYDAATANWGGEWRMPTKDEFYELLNNTTQERTSKYGVNGMLFKSRINGKTIFIPTAGFMNGVKNYDIKYAKPWSSTPYSGNDYEAYYLYSYSTGGEISSHYRYYGRSIRPVASRIDDTIPAE